MEILKKCRNCRHFKIEPDYYRMMLSTITICTLTGFECHPEDSCERFEINF